MCGTRGREVLEEDLGVATPVGDRASHVDHQHLGHARERVRQRQEHEHDRLAGAERELMLVHLGGCHAVSVGGDAALRGAGGPGRVDDRRHVVRLNLRRDLVHGRRLDRFAPRAQLAQRDGALAGAIEGHDVLQRRAEVPNLLDLRRLLGVLAEDHPALGVVEDVAALLGRVGVVDRRDDRAGAERAEIGQRPLRPRAREDRDAVAGMDPERDQAARDLAHRHAELGVRHLHPRIPADEAQRGTVVGDGRLEHHLNESVRPGGAVGARARTD